MATTYSISDLAREFDLTLRAKRLGLSLQEARELIDMYDSPRDTGPQLRKFLLVLAQHRAQLEAQRAELEATLSEIGEHEKEARALLARLGGRTAPAATAARTRAPRGAKAARAGDTAD